MCLVGEHLELGGWDLRRCIRLRTTPQDFPWWSSYAVPLPHGINIKYKYFVMRETSCDRCKMAFCQCAEARRIRWEDIQGHGDHNNRVIILNEGSYKVCDIFSKLFKRFCDVLNADAISYA